MKNEINSRYLAEQQDKTPNDKRTTILNILINFVVRINLYKATIVMSIILRSLISLVLYQIYSRVCSIQTNFNLRI